MLITLSDVGLWVPGKIGLTLAFESLIIVASVTGVVTIARSLENLKSWRLILPRKSKRKLITAFEAAERLGKTEDRVWEYAKNGTLDAERFGRSIMICEDSLEKAAQVRIGRPPGSKNKRPSKRDESGIRGLSKVERHFRDLGAIDCRLMSSGPLGQFVWNWVSVKWNASDSWRIYLAMEHPPDELRI